jgi:hypothetical protein
VRLDHTVDSLADEVDELRRLEWAGAPFLAEHPAGQIADVRELGDEDALLDAAALDHPLDPPRGVGVELDPGLADDLAVLPLLLASVLERLELLREAEVPLASRGEADVAADSRDAERADVLAVVVEADHVPGAVLREEGVGVDGPFRLLVATDRVVGELDRTLLGDRVLELRQPSAHLRRVVRVAHLDAHRGLGRLLDEAWPAQREVLQREAERLGIGELAFEHVERGLEGCELVLLQLELGEEVVLGAEVVELLAGELVALRVERNAEGDQLRAVGVEAARECLVRHLRVSLHRRLDVPRGERPSFRHEERD